MAQRQPQNIEMMATAAATVRPLDQRLCLQLKAVRQMPSKDNVNTKPLVFVVEELEMSVIILFFFANATLDWVVTEVTRCR